MLVFDGWQKAVGSLAGTMSDRLRSRSLDRYGGVDWSSAEQQSGRGAGHSRGGRSLRVPSSDVDSGLNDDITDTAWRRSMQSLTSSTSPGQSTSPRGVGVAKDSPGS